MLNGSVIFSGLDQVLSVKRLFYGKQEEMNHQAVIFVRGYELIQPERREGSLTFFTEKATI